MTHNRTARRGLLIKRLFLAVLAAFSWGALVAHAETIPETATAGLGIPVPVTGEEESVGLVPSPRPALNETEEPAIPPKTVVRIGMVSDGAPERDGLQAQVCSELHELLDSRYQLEFPEKWNLAADSTMAGADRCVSEALKTPELDIVLTVGLMSSLSLARRGPLPKPAIALTIVDREILGVPSKGGASGVRNLAYITTPAPLRRDLEAFKNLRTFTRVAILAEGELLRSVPELPVNVLKTLEDLGLEVSVIPAASSAAEVLTALPKDTEAVYVTPLIRMPEAEFDQLIQGLIERRIPGFSFRGVPEVERGLLATLHPVADYLRLARRTALYVQRILSGEAPETFPVDFPEGEQLTLNMATARAIGFYPTYATLGEANLLNEESQETPTEWTLRSAVEKAVAANLELAAKSRAVAAGAQNIPAARANLKPHLDASTTAIMIDEDTATSYQPERSWTGSVKLRQLLYDDKAFANLKISKLLQDALEFEYAGQELDVIQLAAVAYLNVLRAKTFERIQKNNQQRTRTHLELAEVRQALGTAGPGEVYRWQIELSSSRIEVMNASARRESAEIDLNRILHRPQEEPFRTQEIGLEDDLLLPARDLAARYLNAPWRFDRFRDYMVQEGVARSPELARIDQGIHAQERMLAATKRAYYVPSIGVQAEVKREFALGGAGAESGGGLTGLIMPPAEEDTDWSVGLQASLPLYAGGGRKAERVQASEKLEELRLQRQAVQEKIEERVRVASHAASASNVNIDDAQKRMEAAKKNLELVQDAYRRGTVSVIDLLDAQTAALTAELSAAGSTYQFLLDLMELERSIAHFAFVASDEERAAWRGTIEQYLNSQETPAP